MEGSYRKMVALLFRAISQHAVEGSREDYHRFRSEVDALAERLTPALPMAERFIVIGEALRTLEDYSRRTSDFLRVQSGELQKMIAMLTQTVIAVSANTETSVTGLRDIEKSLERARMVEDIRSVKTQLGECLEGVRGEALRQKADGKAALESLQQELARSKERLSGAPTPTGIDLATSLPGKADAQKALEAAVAAPDPRYLWLAVVNRLQTVNARFGYWVGDQVLAAAANHFRSGLPADDKLYRWQGPALMAILCRKGGIDTVRGEVRRLAEHRLEKTFVVDARSFMLPISTNWAVYPIVPPLDVLLRKVEIFTVAQLSRE
jgi:GGDEF domain-containing protein